MTNIKNWPADERPREKLLKYGASFLSDAELLAIFLRTGKPGLSAVDLARQLITRHGSLASILVLSQRAFCDNDGLGPAKYAQLSATLEMGRRYMKEQLQQQNSFERPEQVKSFLQMELQAEANEVFACLFLDSQQQLIAFERLFYGTIDAAPVYPRVIARKAIELDASSVIMAHNHPSGIAEPSSNDRLITRQVKEALQLLEIRLLDHIVVGFGQQVSMAEQGLV